MLCTLGKTTFERDLILIGTLHQKNGMLESSRFFIQMKSHLYQCDDILLDAL